MSVVRPVSAQRALSAMSKKDHTIQPTNPAHIALYEELRETHARISVSLFKRWLSAKHVQSMETTYLTRIWCVPKQNFPDGLPEGLAEFVKTQDEITQLQRRGGITGSVDRSSCYLIDDCVEKHRLGPNVSAINFSRKTQ